MPITDEEKKRPTIVRTEEMLERYRAERNTKPAGHNPFVALDRAPLKDFEYWVLVENKFPWDALVTTHHLLVPKRTFVETFEMTDPERREFEEIKRSLRSEYDAIVEAFPSIQSVPSHIHFHLIIWKRR